jgi:EAL domain-containing protein (putative c-di-GMP-specific phosphodiesterase class I)
MAVNVSAAEFHGKDFLSGVRAVLEDTGLAPDALELELTESSLMQDKEPTTTILRALKDLGVHIAIDDFGTGYSSLSYLRRFPIDTLKIDQSFVRDIGVADGDAKLVNAIIAIGNSLDLRVVAEGIETLEQCSLLQTQGCVEGQGFYFGRPMAADIYADVLRRNAT